MGASEPGKSNKILPVAPGIHPDDREHERMWGFADSGFAVQGGKLCLASRRYESGGTPLPAFAPFVEKAVGVALDLSDRRELSPVVVPTGPDVSQLVESLGGVLAPEAISIEPGVRLRHGHGHHLEEVLSLLFSGLKRVPDVVVFPATDDEIQAVLRLAREANALVIPYGGGTTVSLSLECPKTERPIISLDLGRKNRVLWIDPVSRTACIEAGAVGRVLEAQLNEHGYTLGHEPDSIEFSTLGGWIATNASGMKKNRYGNIEDIVLDVTIVTAEGLVEHPRVVPRASHGLDVRRLILGSEGLIGVIARATVKVHKLPEVKLYGSLVFPNWQRGREFLEEISEWQALPASVRLVDNMQFQFGQALKPPSGAMKSAMQKFLVTKVKGVSLSEMVACTLVYEGGQLEQADLKRRIEKTAARYGGFSGGGDAGRAGYNLTFGIAYIRDFLLQHWVLGDSFETSAPWGKVDDVIDAVKESVKETHRALKMPGHPFVTARVSQVYQTGVCIYFYIGAYYKGVAEPLTAARLLENRAREAILAAGGSLSHHHGIGKVWAGYQRQVKSQAALGWAKATRDCLDPDGIFANDNQKNTD